MKDIEEEVRKIAKIEQDGGLWTEIGRMSDALVAYIAENDVRSSVDDILYQYLDDYDIRSKDPKYADYQLSIVLNKLDNRN